MVTAQIDRNYGNQFGYVKETSKMYKKRKRQWDRKEEKVRDIDKDEETDRCTEKGDKHCEWINSSVEKIGWMFLLLLFLLLQFVWYKSVNAEFYAHNKNEKWLDHTTLQKDLYKVG